MVINHIWISFVSDRYYKLLTICDEYTVFLSINFIDVAIIITQELYKLQEAVYDHIHDLQLFWR